jgi:hypothetical protein
LVVAGPVVAGLVVGVDGDGVGEMLRAGAVMVGGDGGGGC